MKITPTILDDKLEQLEMLEALNVIMLRPVVQHNGTTMLTPPWAKDLLSKVEGISDCLLLKKEKEEKVQVSEIPPVTLGSAVIILQRSALFDNGYSEDHKCDLCPHIEVSKTLGSELKKLLNKFPLVMDKYA